MSARVVVPVFLSLLSVRAPLQTKTPLLQLVKHSRAPTNTLTHVLFYRNATFHIKLHRSMWSFQWTIDTRIQSECNSKAKQQQKNWSPQAVWLYCFYCMNCNSCRETKFLRNTVGFEAFLQWREMVSGHSDTRLALFTFVLVSLPWDRILHLNRNCSTEEWGEWGGGGKKPYFQLFNTK